VAELKISSSPILTDMLQEIADFPRSRDRKASTPTGEFLWLWKYYDYEAYFEPF
jgi:hypothetical protein